ncbi:MAG: HupE/UreJ family protein [Flavobacteriaceae bacterium]
MALLLPYDAKAWKRLLILVSIFTLGRTISLFLSVFDVVK